MSTANTQRSTQKQTLKYRPQFSAQEVRVLMEALHKTMLSNGVLENDPAGALGSELYFKMETFIRKVDAGILTHGYITKGREGSAALPSMYPAQAQKGYAQVGDLENTENEEPIDTAQVQITPRTAYRKYKLLGERAEELMTEDELENVSAYKADLREPLTDLDKKRINNRMMKSL